MRADTHTMPRQKTIKCETTQNMSQHHEINAKLQHPGVCRLAIDRCVECAVFRATPHFLKRGLGRNFSISTTSSNEKTPFSKNRQSGQKSGFDIRFVEITFLRFRKCPYMWCFELIWIFSEASNSFLFDKKSEKLRKKIRKVAKKIRIFFFFFFFFRSFDKKSQNLIFFFRCDFLNFFLLSFAPTSCSTTPKNTHIPFIYLSDQ